MCLFPATNRIFTHFKMVSCSIDHMQVFLISNFRSVLNIVCFLLGNSPASQIETPGNYPKENTQHMKVI